MRSFLCAAGLAALTACSPSVPDSAAGVGFGDYEDYQQERRARDAQLAGNPLPTPDAVSTETLGETSAQTASTGTGDGNAEDLAAETRAALQSQEANSGEPVVHADPGNPPPQTVTTSTGISEETNFDAVSAERSIESDAELIERNRARYKVIEPEDLPARSGGSEPNIVQYALNNSHPVGTQVYSRSGFNAEAKFRRNCAAYASPDQAQIDFLSRGGPQRDRLGLDPDGDGYACDWNPAPFRKAVGG